RGKLTGIVDWVNASFGPPGIDIGHGRVNLAVLFGLDAANGFLDACLRLLGDQPHQLFWDCRAALEFAPTPPDLAQWHDTGRSDLTLPVAVLRLDAYVHSLAIRLR
ncbi:MAG: aminoglycoside phosphotransferase family protein, partial [Chloroflexi bacterium]|nr:aminoglycoside phosphotransferase family protein [Chloroflexota bacterium]